MKGVILAGGLGTRLMPMTRVTNKHLLPVYDRPMIHFPLQQLVDAGFDEVLIVTGGEWAGHFLRLLGNGREFGLRHLHYTYQEGEGGIAAALALASDFADGQPVAVLLGDNIFEMPLRGAIEAFRRAPEGAMVLLKDVAHPERFGVAQFEGTPEHGRLVRIVEKPALPPSAWAVTGCYLYDGRVFDWIGDLKPSERGELEITDINNRYLEQGLLRHRLVEGWWTDAGTVASLLSAAQRVECAVRAGRFMAPIGAPELS